ncbi:hypothetical protein [Pilimelia columellifera]|uniref:hypothetical protein n=1 Tax=Pilimelia columellifera TaxID=706574 RepID=UPI0031E1FE1C
MLARREVGNLFSIYLAAFPNCTQTQLALMTEHDRSDISNFIRGARSPRVTDIDVLNRVADGMGMPDESRLLLGLAPANVRMSDVAARTGWYCPEQAASPLRLAVCGSRSPGCNSDIIDESILALSRLLMRRRCEVDHGPVGVGVEVMTFIADRYNPPTLKQVVGIFGHPNVVRNADYVLVVGGGPGTLDEVELALVMDKRLLPFRASGGSAASAYTRLHREPAVRGWLAADIFAQLGDCSTADDYTSLVDHVFTLGATRSD